MRSTPAQLLAICLCAAALAVPPAAQAEVFHVTTTADVSLVAPDGACDSGPGGTCPLREAVREAGSLFSAGDDTIELPPGTYSFGPGAEPLIEPAGYGKLTIVGGTARDTTIDGMDQAGIFTVVTGGSLELRQLTLRDGNRFYLPGGAIRNDGTLELTDAALVSNETNSGGGAIASTGTLTLERVTLSDNRSHEYGAALSVVRTGGANPGTATITNSTMGGNQSVAGGALMLAGGGTITLLNSTVAGNSGNPLHGVGGVRVEQAGSTLVLANSIVAGNTPHDCSVSFGGTIVSQGGNVTGDEQCATGALGDPKLGPLQDNGGPTDTFALLAGSAAVDTATAPGCPAVDQRGVPRPVGAACDAGAFEAVVANTEQQPQQPQQQPPPPPADVTAPAISNVFATRRVFAVNPRAAAAVRRRVSRGTTFRFTLSEAANVSLGIRRRNAGRWVAVRGLQRTATAGVNRVRFSGRVLVGGRTRALRPGRYCVRLRAVDAAGNRSARATIRFRIVAAVRSR